MSKPELLEVFPGSRTPIARESEARHEALMSTISIGGESSDRLAEQWLGIRVFEPENKEALTENPHTLLVPGMWSEGIERDFHASRLRTLAEQTGCRVIGIDMAGMRDASTPLTHEQKEALERGEFGKFGEAAWEAVINSMSAPTADQMNELHKAPPEERKVLLAKYREAATEKLGKVDLIGYSMGTSTIAGMLRDIPEGIEIDNVVFWEGAGYTDRSVRRLGSLGLAANFMITGTQNKPYFAHNIHAEEGFSPEESPTPNLMELIKQIFRQREAHFATWKAIARGRTLHELTQALDGSRGADIRNANFTVLSGEKSVVSTEKENTEFAQALRDLGLEVNAEVFKGADHNSHEAIGVFASVLKRILHR